MFNLLPGGQKPGPAIAGFDTLRPWLEQAAMRELLRLERLHCQRALPRLFGYRLLQIGSWGFDAEFTEKTPMPRHWVLGIHGGKGLQADCDGQSLPIPNKSVDVVLLPHSLEMVASPHRLLRETDRILCDHGHVMIMGFNPLSAWGLRRLWPMGQGRPPRGMRSYPLRRVHDWLELLDFEVLEVKRFGPGFPWLRRDGTDSRLFWMRRLLAWWCPAYLMLARKRVVPVTPIRKPAWSRPQVVAPVAMPGARSQTRRRHPS